MNLTCASSKPSIGSERTDSASYHGMPALPQWSLNRPKVRDPRRIERTLSRRDAGLDEFVDREAAFLAELQDGQFLVGEILRTSGDAEVGNGFHQCVQEKANMALLATDSNHRYQPIL